MANLVLVHNVAAHPITLQDGFLFLLSFFLPPLPVFLRKGASHEFWLCLVLAFFLHIPGVVYAWYIVYITSDYGDYVYQDLENQGGEVDNIVSDSNERDERTVQYPSEYGALDDEPGSSSQPPAYHDIAPENREYPADKGDHKIQSS